MGQVYSVSVPLIPSQFYQNNTPLCELISIATTRPAITEIYIDIYVNAVATISVGFGRSGTVGTAYNPIYLLPEDGGNSANNYLTVATQWSVPPGIPSLYNRRATLNGAATSGGIAWWRFPEGFILPVGGSVSVWMIADSVNTINNTTGDVTFILDG